mmetsp:Transcript_38022/g.90332  ORF Transcript_38022/g.90332 Transcript_38022/m.90332 type:complete len:200 (-) Transcript_38022:738-1337(-)
MGPAPGEPPRTPGRPFLDPARRASLPPRAGDAAAPALRLLARGLPPGRWQTSEGFRGLRSVGATGAEPLPARRPPGLPSPQAAGPASLSAGAPRSGRSAGLPRGALPHLRPRRGRGTPSGPRAPRRAHRPSARTRAWRLRGPSPPPRSCPLPRRAACATPAAPAPAPRSLPRAWQPEPRLARGRTPSGAPPPPACEADP